MNPNSVLFVIRSAPYGSNRAREGLDAALASAVFEQPLSILFMDDGVFALRKTQTVPHSTTFAQTLNALPLYDIDRVYLYEKSLADRGMSEADLCISATKLDRRGVAALMQASRHILSF